eukprot:TRINITY_DN14768_c0_g1_i1.p1 TRINITY_DN14768_c0_g1~~TRINITY_DN14768_c0_g1_i1.p1  ORF type:complete len:213 (+),score=48.59 TRINITY_DN14768_c0_g1_i1:79-717(+)
MSSNGKASDITLSDVDAGELSDRQDGSEGSVLMRSEDEGGSEEGIPEWMQDTTGSGVEEESDEDQPDPSIECKILMSKNRRLETRIAVVQDANEVLQEELTRATSDYSKLEETFFTLSSEKATWSSDKHKLNNSIASLEESLAASGKSLKEKTQALDKILLEHYSIVAERDALKEQNELLQVESAQMHESVREAYSIAEALQRPRHKKRQAA